MMTIVGVAKKNEKQVKKVIKKEWLRHNKENKYADKEKEFWFAALDGKKVIGQIYGNTNAGVAYLDDLIVSKKYRNKGVGKMLLVKFEEIARKNKCHACLLATTDNHSDAIQFYKRNGYKIESTLHNMYWNIDEYYMVKRFRV